MVHKIRKQYCKDVPTSLGEHPKTLSCQDKRRLTKYVSSEDADGVNGCKIVGQRCWEENKQMDASKSIKGSHFFINVEEETCFFNEKY